MCHRVRLKHKLKDIELPLTLPNVTDYKRSSDGKSPLENAKDWINLIYDGKEARRESSTMPGSAGSSWYFLRYIDPHNENEMVNKELEKHWMPVDLYIGGSEHAVGHLLYSRFWMNFLFDKGFVSHKEPFQKLFHQGMILGTNGEKMSKSRGNVINPDEVVRDYGADSLRLYEMFMGPLQAEKPWQTNGIDGAKRWLDRVYRLFSEEEFKNKYTNENDHKLDYSYNFTVKKVTNDYEYLSFNTAIAQMMTFINDVYKQDKIYLPYLESFVQLLAPICPHLGAELWEMLGHQEIIDYVSWPTYDESKLVQTTVKIAVQICGKVREVIEVSVNASEKEIEETALAHPGIISRIEGKTIKKIIVIKGKIVNIVAI